MSEPKTTTRSDDGPREFVTASLAGQLFSVPVLSVHDILSPHALTNVSLAPPEVAGALNLRGRIVTAIDLRGQLETS